MKNQHILSLIYMNIKYQVYTINDQHPVVSQSSPGVTNSCQTPNTPQQCGPPLLAKPPAAYHHQEQTFPLQARPITAHYPTPRQTTPG